MSDQNDIVEDDPDYERPAEPGGGTTEVEDAPMGVPADADPSEKDQPGIPTEGEPPASE